jgi:NAD(P)H-dependent FMN reductase
MSEQLKLALICGSVRMGRKSPMVAEHLIKQIEMHYPGVAIDYIDLADHPLPVMQERRGHHNNLPAAVEKLGVQLEEADAILVVTPKYNGGYPGVLKNALDYFYDEFTKKPVGIVSVSSGRMGGNLAHQMLVNLFMRVGSFVSPARLYIAEVSKNFDENGNLQNEHIVKSVQRFVDEYFWFTEAIIAKKHKQ